MRPICLFSLCLALGACSTPPRKIEPARPPEPQAQGEAPAPVVPGSMAERIVALATSEWTYFGNQVVVFEGDEEKIPHVGKWEDDDTDHSERVSRYWQAVERPRLAGTDCQQPWSAAFVSWVMREAGLAESEFPRADAHWVYLAHMMRADSSAAPFLVHTINDYRPRPGDLICSTRGPDAPLFDELPRPSSLQFSKLHCDIVVENDGQTLAAIGGNVRNSVSKSILHLMPDGHLQPTRPRPWFVVLENRLDR